MLFSYLLYRLKTGIGYNLHWNNKASSNTYVYNSDWLVRQCINGCTLFLCNRAKYCFAAFSKEIMVLWNIVGKTNKQKKHLSRFFQSELKWVTIETVHCSICSLERNCTVTHHHYSFLFKTSILLMKRESTFGLAGGSSLRGETLWSVSISWSVLSPVCHGLLGRFKHQQEFNNCAVIKF